MVIVIFCILMLSGDTGDAATDNTAAGGGGATVVLSFTVAGLVCVSEGY